jgi:hypothetical protein
LVLLWCVHSVQSRDCVACATAPTVSRRQAFEDQILEDLFQAIMIEFPAAPDRLSDLDFERSFHMHFVDDKSRYFIGREDIIHELFRHCDSGYLSASLPLVVVGAPGSGKTSLMAAFAKK